MLREREECIQELLDEIARLKGEKGKPKIKPSRLEPEKKAQGQQEDTEGDTPQDEQGKKKRPGSEKRQKTANLIIHETKVIEPNEAIPTGSEFKGYQDYTVQELMKRAHNTLYRIAIWQTPTGEYRAREITESGARAGSLWSDAEKLLTLSIPSLSCHPTETVERKCGNGILTSRRDS